MTSTARSSTIVPRPRRSRRGAILLKLALGVAAMGGLTWGGMVAGTYTVHRHQDPLSNQELGIALTRVGLAAEQLAAAGCTTQEVTALVGDARDHLGTNIQALRDAEQAWASAKAEVDRLTKLVRGGKHDQLNALTAARTAFTAADEERQGLLDNFYNASAGDLQEGKLTVLQTLKDHRMWDMPKQYLAAGRTEPEWVQLRDALANHRIAEARNEEPDPGAHTFLLSVQAEPAVSAAATNLLQLPAVTGAWNAAVYPQ
ncbi:MAG: hypothetical protein WD749_02805 [Phycisphaerales bacterium]